MRSILTGVQGLVSVPESVGSELECMCCIQSHRYACRCRFTRIGTVIELVGRMSLSDGLLVARWWGGGEVNSHFDAGWEAGASVTSRVIYHHPSLHYAVALSYITAGHSYLSHANINKVISSRRTMRAFDAAVNELRLLSTFSDNRFYQAVPRIIPVIKRHIGEHQ